MNSNFDMFNFNEGDFQIFLNNENLIRKTITFLQLSDKYNNFHYYIDFILKKLEHNYNDEGKRISIKNIELILNDECKSANENSIYLKYLNDKTNKNIFNYLKNNKIIYISIGYYLKTDYGEIDHVLGITLDFNKNQYYLLDSSCDAENPIILYEMTKKITEYFNEKLNLNINIKPFIPKLETLKFTTESIQGNYGLCSIWIQYSFFIHMKNSNIKYKSIFKELIKYKQYERDNLILKFMLYTYTYNKNQIESSISLNNESIEIPHFTF